MPIAALDLGYRRFPDYIRFGFIVDSLGNKFELRLPHGNMMSSYLRDTIKFLAKKGVEKQYIKDLNDFFVWDSVQGTSLEETKTQLKKISELTKKQAVEMPEAWKGGFLGFVKMRNRGLIKLKKISNEILDEGAETNENVQDTLRQTIEIIEKWQAKNSYFETEKEHFRRKFLGRRKLLFRSLVKWLVEHYAQLIWEEDLKLSVIAAKSKKSSRVTDAALKESNKYRQWTGLYQLRLFIKEQAAKTPAWLQPNQTAYSSYFCDECGASTVSDPAKLILTCANGHEKDQDERAAINMLKTANRTSAQNSPVIVPPYLKDFIVKMQ